MSRLGRARTSTTVVFFLAGALFASWAPRIPAVKAHLHLTNAALGGALFGPAIGSLSAMLITGALVTRLGSRTLLRWAVVAFCVPPAFIGTAHSFLSLFVVLLAWGVGIGMLEVSMNAQAVVVQAEYGRPVMSGLHAAYSAGALAGAGIGSVVAAARVSVEWHLLVASALCLFAGLAAGTGLIWVPSELAHHTGARHFARPQRQLVLLGAMTFACFLCEGAAADWSAVYIRDTLRASAGVAGLGYTVFSAAMTAGRLSGDRLTVALGGRRLVMASGALAALGFGAGLATGTVPGALLGFAAFGLGLACIVPVLFSSAGAIGVPGPSIALVTTSGYLGFLTGPPTIGAVSGLAGLQPTLGIVAVLPAAITLLERRRLRPASAPGA